MRAVTDKIAYFTPLVWKKFYQKIGEYTGNSLSNGDKNLNYSRTINLQHNKKVNISKAPLCLPSGRIFQTLYISHRKDAVIGINEKTHEFIKISLFYNPSKVRGLEEEANILIKLSERGCISCPKIIETGKIDSDHLTASIEDEKFLSGNSNEKFSFIVQEYIETAEYLNIADLILTLLEQRSLGVYQGDIKPENIRYDEKRGICVLVDYDQAELIDEGTANLSALEYLKWCDQTEMRKYGHTSWLRHFPEISYKRDLLPLFIEDALNLEETTLFKRQITTNTPNGVYHTIKGNSIFANGIRDLESRKPILDSIDFKKGERVLDIGCNSGLLCHYLYDRGCDVTGLEIDPSMVLAAGIIARITKRSLNFICLDIDKGEIPAFYDTIMLFSVLHHTSNMKDNARKIAAACDRIIIECRLIEKGSKPDQEKWGKTSDWNYESLGALTSALNELFPAFSLFENYGVGDRNRFIFEYRKTSGNH